MCWCLRYILRNALVSKEFLSGIQEAPASVARAKKSCGFHCEFFFFYCIIKIHQEGILHTHTNLNIEKIAFKVVQMKFLAMHITNQKLSLNIFTVRKCTKYLNGT